MKPDILGTLTGWLREHGDLVHLRIWPEHEIVVGHPELVRELLVNHHDAIQRWERGLRVFGQWQRRSVFVREGEPWQQQRRALLPAFAPKAVDAFAPAIADAAARAFAKWPDECPDWPIESALTSVAMDVILQLLFSSRFADDARRAEQAVHVGLTSAQAEMFWPASWPDAMPWKRKKRCAHATLDALVRRHIGVRLASSPEMWPDDLLTRLLRLHRDDPATWDVELVRDECLTTFVAGHETVASTLARWCWLMAAHPGWQDQARTEVMVRHCVPSLPWVTATMEKTLRLYPAVPVLFARQTTRPMKLDSWTFPARTLFIVPMQHLHHDPRWFVDPLAYRPERFGPDAPAPPRGAFLPFGCGPRVCLGQHLTMTELVMVAAELLRHFEWRVPINAPTPKPVAAISLRPAKPLRLSIQRTRTG